MVFFPLLSTLFSSFVSAESTEADKLDPSIKGSLCYIQANDQVVLVDELLTKRLSLPGGSIEVGESPQQAAKRETWEETGIIVTVLEELTRTETAVIYHCVPDSGIVAFSAQTKEGYHVLPAWYAPTYGLEINQVYLADPHFVAAKEYRYPKQWKAQVLDKNVENSPVHYIKNAANAAPIYHQFELPAIQMLQSWVASLPTLSNHLFVNVMRGLNAISSFYTLLLLFPILYYFFGHEFIIRISFLVLMTFIVVILIQLGFKYPRPYAYDPSLQLAALPGFGVPSLRATATVVWVSYVYHHLIQTYEKFEMHKYFPLLVLIILAQGVASVVLGLHFSSDVLFGYVLGMFIVWNFIRIESHGNSRTLTIISHQAFWWVCFIMLVSFSWFTHSLYLGLISAVALAFLLSVTCIKREKIEAWGNLYIKLIVTWVLILLISYLYQHILSISTYSPTASYFIQCAAWFVMTFIAITIGRVKPIYELKKEKA